MQNKQEHKQCIIHRVKKPAEQVGPSFFYNRSVLIDFLSKNHLVSVFFLLPPNFETRIIHMYNNMIGINFEVTNHNNRISDKLTIQNNTPKYFEENAETPESLSAPQES
jgi:hypothetical protein